MRSKIVQWEIVNHAIHLKFRNEILLNWDCSVLWKNVLMWFWMCIEWNSKISKLTLLNERKMLKMSERHSSCRKWFSTHIHNSLLECEWHLKHSLQINCFSIQMSAYPGWYNNIIEFPFLLRKFPIPVKIHSVGTINMPNFSMFFPFKWGHWAFTSLYAMIMSFTSTNNFQ